MRREHIEDRLYAADLHTQNKVPYTSSDAPLNKQKRFCNTQAGFASCRNKVAFRFDVYFSASSKKYNNRHTQECC